MPKKFQGENTKATEARARKEAKKVEETEKKEKQKEDELWQDDDKNLQKKLQRKEERDKKKQELQERKQTAKALLEKEAEELHGKGGGGAQKMTQAEIAAHQENLRLERLKMEEKARMEASKIVVQDTGDKIEENVNRLEIEGEHARTVEEALHVLGDSEDPVDKHPEKRVKAAYTAFEERRMPELKAENPNLRLSQLRQMLKKEWQRSPENPMNQLRPSIWTFV